MPKSAMMDKAAFPVSIRRREPKGDLWRDLHPNPIIARIYANRGIKDSKELEYKLQRLLPASELGGIDQAVQILSDCVRCGDKIVIVGDYDADGATATAVSMLALRAMGANVDYLIPSRFKTGYGLSPALVSAALTQGAQCLMTVDNGTSAIEGVEAAKLAGLKVVVTDHHLPGEVLPQADAIVNPNLDDDDFLSKTLAGVGVAFYVLCALKTALQNADWFKDQKLPPPVMTNYLDLVAVGTVADVVPLDFNNRILVDRGLQLLRQGQCRPGLRHLLQISKRDLATLQSQDLGFSVGPRLNAAGRMDDMSVGVECLIVDDFTEAGYLAQSLDELNQHRREVEQEMREEALSALAEVVKPHSDALPAAICVYQPHWHGGIIGILSGRLKDKYYRPVVAFAQNEQGQLVGSGRSIPGVHLRDALARVDTLHPGLMLKFGGHAMAAGLTLASDQLSLFESMFHCAIEEQLAGDTPLKEWLTDGDLNAEGITRELVDQLLQAGPWGQGFEAPSFDGEFNVVDARIVGEKHLKLTLEKAQQTQRFSAILFNQGADWRHAERIRLVYQLGPDDFRGRRGVQMIGLYFEGLDPELPGD